MLIYIYRIDFRVVCLCESIGILGDGVVSVIICQIGVLLDLCVINKYSENFPVKTIELYVYVCSVLHIKNRVLKLNL